MANKLTTVEDVIHEYHSQRLSKTVGDWMSVTEAKELILAIVARDMLLEGGTVIHLEYEPCEKSS